MWLAFLGIPAVAELIGLWWRRDDGKSWGPLSNAAWVITDPGAHNIFWWLIPAFLVWLTLHIMFPGVLALGWRGLIWFLLAAVFMWATGRFLFNII